MNNLTLGIIFLALATFGAILKTSLFIKPLVELKRQATRGDKTAQKVYSLSSYGTSLKVVLWTFIGLTAAASFVLISQALPIAISILVTFVFVYILFSLIPTISSNSTVNRVVLTVSAPILSKVVYYLHPIISKMSVIFSLHTRATHHSGLYEKEDLVKLLNKQLEQPDSRITDKQVTSVIKALSFEDKKIREILKPDNKIKTVFADDVIGPILINEIHESGQNYVLVEDKHTEEIVGSLAFDDLGIKSIGYVSDFMDQNVYFINEDDSLSDALSVLVKAKHHALVAVNNFKEFVGIVNIEDILAELLGKLRLEEAVDYDSADQASTKYLKTENDDNPIQSESQVIE
jgi:CBS domain containing-hemolysin-like protein